MTFAKALKGHAILRAVQIIATVGILALLWRLLDGREAGVLLASAQPMWLVAGVLALTTQTVLSAIRWRITAGQLGLHLPYRVAVREYYLSQMINQVLPGGVLGDASRAVRSRDQQGIIAASQAVIFERFAGQVALFVVMTTAIAATFVVTGGLEWPTWSIPIITLIIGAGFAVALVFALVVSLPNPMRTKASVLMGTMAHALIGRRVVFAQITLSFATVACNLAAFAFCARAVGVALSPVMICALVPLILFTMLVPLTVMGWGLREGAAAAFLPLAGVAPTAALAASVAFGLMMLAASTPGVIAVWISHSPVRPKTDIKT